MNSAHLKRLRLQSGPGSRRRGRPRRSQVADTRSKILRAAAQLFHTCGMASVSVDNIIAVADVSKMGFYYHFASKEKVVVAYLEREGRRTIAYVRHQLALQRTQSLAALADVLERVVHAPGFHGHPFLTQAVGHPSPRIRRLCQALQRRLLAEIARLLPPAAPASVALQALMLVEGVLITRLVGADVQAVSAARSALSAIAAANR